MKLWEILKEGKIGAVYRNDAWGVTAKVEDMGKSRFCLEMVGNKYRDDYPSVKLVELCSMAVNEEWLEVKPEPVYVDFLTAWEAYMRGASIRHKSWRGDAAEVWANKSQSEFDSYWMEEQMISPFWEIKEED